MKEKMDRLFIVMPAYNEEESIEGVVRSWYPCLANASAGSRMVVADSGSSDRTHEILARLQNEMPQLSVLQTDFRQHGPKLIALYKNAVFQGADFIFQTDSDGQTNPEEFAAFWKERNMYDAVIGSRSERGDGRGRAFVESVVCLLLRLFFGIRISDANAPFRLMRSELVNKYIDYLPEEYGLPNIMLTVFFVRGRERVVFREVSFGARRAGRNSINLLRIIRIGWSSLWDFSRFRKLMTQVDPDGNGKEEKR